MASSSTSGKRSQCHLSLKQNIEVIKKAESSSKSGTTVRALSDLFGCGKTQISDILKNKESITTLYESNASSSLIRTNKRARVSEYSEINDALYQWYLLAC